MLKLTAFSAIIVLLALPVAANTVYQQGTLLGIEKKVKITPIDYIYETVVSYYETVTYELQIRVGDETYYTDYTPEVQPNWPLPSEWKPDQPIQLRFEKHRLFVKLSYDGEVLTHIAWHKHAKTQ